MDGYPQTEGVRRSCGMRTAERGATGAARRDPPGHTGSQIQGALLHVRKRVWDHLPQRPGAPFWKSDEDGKECGTDKQPASRGHCVPPGGSDTGPRDQEGTGAGPTAT